jgi:hypothetical protein
VTGLEHTALRRAYRARLRHATPFQRALLAAAYVSICPDLSDGKLLVAQEACDRAGLVEVRSALWGVRVALRGGWVPAATIDHLRWTVKRACEAGGLR